MESRMTEAPNSPHPMHAMTTFELSRYRRELESALKNLPTTAPVRADIQRRLGQVKEEQESRLQIRDKY
jgi:hypothetical protein